MAHEKYIQQLQEKKNVSMVGMSTRLSILLFLREKKWQELTRWDQTIENRESATVDIDRFLPISDDIGRWPSILYNVHNALLVTLKGSQL